MFISYAHEDRKHLTALRKQMAVLRQNGEIEDWFDDFIHAGANWQARIWEKLDDADLILLLLTANSLASKYCLEEAERGYARQKEGQPLPVVIPIIVSDCDWKHKKVIQRQHVLPNPPDPVLAWRPQAAAWQNVVDGVWALLESLPPAPPRPFPPVALVAEQLLALLPGDPFVVPPTDRAALHHIIRPELPLPPLYHHWRLRHRGVHWVDYAHLLLLRRIAGLGFPINLLLDDDDPRFAEAALRATSSMVEAMSRGVQMRVIPFKQAIVENEAEREDRAAANGFGVEALRALERAAAAAHADLSSLPDWFRYLARTQKVDGRCIIFAWAIHREMYDTLRYAWSLDPAFIFGGNFMLGGQLGKFGPPGRDLIIEPPQYEELLKWLVTSNPEDAWQLATYLTLGWTDGDVPESMDDAMEALVQGHSSLRNRLTDESQPAELRRATLALLSAMTRWNDRYFKSPPDS